MAKGLHWAGSDVSWDIFPLGCFKERSALTRGVWKCLFWVTWSILEGVQAGGTFISPEESGVRAKVDGKT